MSTVDERVPHVSIVIPVLNGEETIGECLTALQRIDYPEARREIVVVDNASTDRTAELVHQFPVRCVREETRGPSQARNRGILESRGEIVAFTDADCIVTRGWLKALVLPFREPDVGGVAGEILPYPPRTGAERYAARIRHLSPYRYLNRPTFPFAVTANLAFRGEVFDRVGLLDTDSPRGGESTDFCTRFFRVTGQRLDLAPRAVVFHKHRSSAREFVRQQFGYGRGHAYLYDKYRADIPWGWRQIVEVYADLCRSSVLLLGAAAGRAVRHSSSEELEYRWFDLLRKLALRAGFTREALARGNLWL